MRCTFRRISPYEENQTDWGHKSLEMKWVSKTSHKRYAYPTEEQAMVNFKARKKRQIKILTNQLTRARMAYFKVGGVLSEQQPTRFLGHDAFSINRDTSPKLRKYHDITEPKE